ncbi:MAG: HAMP domain-containing sensor histidine kinase [Paenibacillus macerans]|uniref:sensor histidine kinase n=1 Tax=Paenibacillus TaxID=44249 RepID=UPI0024313A26|nr:HAMP domain-containing sensor histidine kinase [Paenibacillus macerans]MDU7476302.1 HAMP domain-containing sensor histidine kinase [Paenibacillus macerans]
MKTSLKMSIKILALMVIPLMVYFLSLGLLTNLFSFVKQAVPVLRAMDWGIFRHTATLLSGAAVAYLFFLLIIKPILHIVHWIQALSQGTFQEPAATGFLFSGTPIFQKSKQFLYKDLLIQMQILTDKLKQSETDRRTLEKSRRDWLAGITHDLKTPLSYIQGYASMIAAERYNWSEREVKTFGAKIEQKSMHIQKLIDDLNASFQSENGKIALQKTRTEMVEFLRRITLDTANSPRSAEYAFAYETELDTCFLEADTALLQRAMQNILVNAVIHNPPGTEIRVSVSKKPLVFCIQVADNGTGMDEQTRNNLFESYYRGMPTHQPAEGSGLGMAIARQLIELHGGSIRAESAPERGTSILIELPPP